MSKVDDIFADMEPTRNPVMPTPTAAPTPSQPALQPAKEGYWKPDLPETPEKVSSKGSRKWILFTVIGVVVAGLLGGGYFAWSKGYLAIPGITPKTDQLFDRMVDSISDVKNAQYSLRMSIKSEPRSTKATEIFLKNANTNTNVNAVTNSNSTVISNTNTYQIEDVGGQIGLGTADLAGTLLGMSGLSDADAFFKTFPADIDLSGGIMLYFEADKKLSVANGSIRIDGTYTGGDASVSIDLEARKKNADLYGIVNKFPSFFGIDPSGIKGKWIKLNSGDYADSIDPKSFDEVDTQEIITGLKTNLKRALQQKLFTVQQKLPAETIGGIKSEHYLIKIDTTKIVDVYNAFIEEERTKGTDVKQFETVRDDINKPENIATLQRIVDNSRVEIWVDKVKGLLRQTKWELTLVPPAGIERLKDKQFLLSTTLTLEKVNENVSVDVPSNPVDMDEAARLLTGVTKEEQQLQKQLDRVGDLQRVLNAYQKKIGSYPDTLDQLTPKMRELDTACTTAAEQRRVNANANGNTNSYSYLYDENADPNCYLYAGYKTKSVNITDAYTGTTFTYTKDGADFKVSYQLHFGDSVESTYYKETYAEGSNTMTSKDVSLEMETSSEKYAREHPVNTNSNTNVNTNSGILDTTTDADSDGITNYEETNLYLTNPNLEDSDGDGFDDKTEICGGYNPNGSGKSADMLFTPASGCPSS